MSSDGRYLIDIGSHIEKRELRDIIQMYVLCSSTQHTHTQQPLLEVHLNTVSLLHSAFTPTISTEILEKDNHLFNFIVLATVPINCFFTSLSIINISFGYKYFSFLEEKGHGTKLNGRTRQGWRDLCKSRDKLGLKLLNNHVTVGFELYAKGFSLKVW